MLGGIDGYFDGDRVGIAVGLLEGRMLGGIDGYFDGDRVGTIVGLMNGRILGITVVLHAVCSLKVGTKVVGVEEDGLRVVGLNEEGSVEGSSSMMVDGEIVGSIDGPVGLLDGIGVGQPGMELKSPNCTSRPLGPI